MNQAVILCGFHDLECHSTSSTFNQFSTVQMERQATIFVTGGGRPRKFPPISHLESKTKAYLKRRQTQYPALWLLLACRQDTFLPQSVSDEAKMAAPFGQHTTLFHLLWPESDSADSTVTSVCLSAEVCPAQRCDQSDCFKDLTNPLLMDTHTTYCTIIRKTQPTISQDLHVHLLVCLKFFCHFVSKSTSVNDFFSSNVSACACHCFFRNGCTGLSEVQPFGNRFALCNDTLSSPYIFMQSD